MNKDARIGFLTLALVIVLLAFNSLRDARIGTFGNELGLIFSQVHGLRAGDPVTIGGVPAGRVVAIDFAPKSIQDQLAPLVGEMTLVRALIALDRKRKIPRESTYTVVTDFNGRRWIEITVSPSREEIGFGETFFAEGTARQDDQMKTTIDTLSILSDQTEQLREMLADPEFRLRTKDTASNLRFYSRELRMASVDAPAQLEEFEKTLNAQDAAMMGQIQKFDDKTKDVRQRMVEMSPQMSETLQGWSTRMERLGDRLSATLQMAVERSGEYEALVDRALAQYLDPKAVQTLITQTKKWARKLEEYRFLAEDLHALTSDPTVRADLKQAIGKLEAKSVEMQKRLQHLEKLLDENPLSKMVGAGKGKPEATASPASQASPEPASSPLDDSPEAPVDPAPVQGGPDTPK